MFESSPLRILVADDSAFMRIAIARMIESDPALRVCGTAIDGVDAVEKVARLNPDVVTLDVEMPHMNGLAALREIMARFPCPVIMVSSLTRHGAEITLDAMDLGAFDYVAKPASYVYFDLTGLRNELVAKLHAAGEAARRPWRPGVPEPFTTTMLTTTTTLPTPMKAPARAAAKAIPRRALRVAPTVVCIGTSTGGPKALQHILCQLPVDLPASVIVVQHMPLGFTASLAVRLNALCRIEVREAHQGDLIEPGVVLIAPAGQHLRLSRRNGSVCTTDLNRYPGDASHIPSVDVMMLSAAETYGAAAMGVILTGMGADGAQGMKAIHAAGGFTVGQDEASCAVYGMPRVCAEMGTLQRVVPISQIAEEIVQATRDRGADSAGIQQPLVGSLRAAATAGLSRP